MGTYYIIYQSWFMVFGDLILLLVGIYSVCKNDLKIIKNNLISENEIKKEF